MSITLTDSTGVSLKINAWNWGVFHAALERANVFEPEVLVPLRFGGGMTLEPAENYSLQRSVAERLLQFLTSAVGTVRLG